MAVITKIETQKNKSRVNIFVDDSFFCGLNKETAILFGLKENKEIDEDRLKSAIFESEVKSAFEKSLDIVGRRMHSKKELIDKLIKKGYQPEVCEKVIQKLEEYHYIDDALFAKQFVASNKKLSKRIDRQADISLCYTAWDIPVDVAKRGFKSKTKMCLVHADVEKAPLKAGVLKKLKIAIVIIYLMSEHVLSF